MYHRFPSRSQSSSEIHSLPTASWKRGKTNRRERDKSRDKQLKTRGRERDKNWDKLPYNSPKSPKASYKSPKSNTAPEISPQNPELTKESEIRGNFRSVNSQPGGGWKTGQGGEEER
eukprot:1348008-Amorphochlora_amoeboformis.AAC.1